MKEKLKKLFKDEKKKNENLVFFLIVLVITLFLVNKIIVGDENESIPENTDNEKQLVKEVENENELEKRLEKILGKIYGVGNVCVMITYSESGSIFPLYNESSNSSKIEENIEDGNKKTTENNETKKEILVDSNSKPITQKTVCPKIEGAIITAEGASNSKVKENIIFAVEAVTGLATHKIQVFEMN